MQNYRPFPPCILQQMLRNLSGWTDRQTCHKTVTVGQMDQRTHVQVERGYFSIRTDGRTNNPNNPPKGGSIKISLYTHMTCSLDLPEWHSLDVVIASSVAVAATHSGNLACVGYSWPQSVAYVTALHHSAEYQQQLPGSESNIMEMKSTTLH